MKQIILICLISCFFNGCWISTSTSIPEPQLPGVSKQTFDLHQKLMSMSQTLNDINESPKMAFMLSWDPDSTGRADGALITRADGLAAEFEEIAHVSAPVSSWVDTFVADRIRYVYCLYFYIAQESSDTLWSDPSNKVSGTWMIFGDPINTRSNITMADTIWTSSDIIVFNIPNGQSYELVWITEPIETGIWKGLYDVTGDGFVGISDLSFYGENYNKSAIDTIITLEE